MEALFKRHLFCPEKSIDMSFSSISPGVDFIQVPKPTNIISDEKRVPSAGSLHVNEKPYGKRIPRKQTLQEKIEAQNLQDNLINMKFLNFKEKIGEGAFGTILILPKLDELTQINVRIFA